jgi:hypothetical protein
VKLAICRGRSQGERITWRTAVRQNESGFWRRRDGWAILAARRRGNKGPPRLQHGDPPRRSERRTRAESIAGWASSQPPSPPKLQLGSRGASHRRPSASLVVAPPSAVERRVKRCPVVWGTRGCALPVHGASSAASSSLPASVARPRMSDVPPWLGPVARWLFMLVLAVSLLFALRRRHAVKISSSALLMLSHASAGSDHLSCGRPDTAVAAASTCRRRRHAVRHQ